MESIIGLVMIVVIVLIIVRNSKAKKAKAQERMQRLVNIQNIVSNSKSDKLILSEKQLQNAMKSFVANNNKEMTSAVTQLNKASNPKSFFAQLDRVYEIIQNLDRLETVSPGSVSPTPAQMKQTVESSLTSEINAMIDRAWVDAQMEAAKYKKEDTKAAKYQTFFDTMAIFTDKMKPENTAHLEELKKTIGL